VKHPLQRRNKKKLKKWIFKILQKVLKIKEIGNLLKRISMKL
jgi:hypothetical protein